VCLCTYLSSVTGGGPNATGLVHEVGVEVNAGEDLQFEWQNGETLESEAASECGRELQHAPTVVVFSVRRRFACV
jgi:hypothetical protein